MQQHVTQYETAMQSRPKKRSCGAGAASDLLGTLKRVTVCFGAVLCRNRQSAKCVKKENEDKNEKI